MTNYTQIQNVTAISIDQALNLHKESYFLRAKKEDIFSCLPRDAKLQREEKIEENAQVLEETGISFEYTLKGRFEDKEGWRFDLWEVKGPGDFVLQYRQGIGHSYSFKFYDGKQWQTLAISKLPSTLDILYCIATDDTHGETFENWCDNFGYDSDSRKAEKIYNACRDQTDMYRRNYTFDLHSYERLEDY